MGISRHPNSHNSQPTKPQKIEKDSTQQTTLTPEKLKLLKRKNRRLLEKISMWQGFKYVKPLICRKCNTTLVPKESRLKIILRCPDCGHIQTYIPNTILKTKLDFPEILIKNQTKTGKHN